MGNSTSTQGEAQKNQPLFDHAFKAFLHTSSGPVISKVFGEVAGEKRTIQVICTEPSMNITEKKTTEKGIVKTQADLNYAQITALTWDHANSEIKIVFNSSSGSENFLIFTMHNSIEFEAELKLRLSAMVSSNPKAKPPTTMYVGVFAGATKPKPFQRNRPNLSRLPSGKLPPLRVMRDMALELKAGSYKPCAQGSSRRVDIAFQHIYEGANCFFLRSLGGPKAVASQWRSDSTLTFTDDSLVFRPRGSAMDTKIEFGYWDIVDWRVNEDSGIEISGTTGEVVTFGFEFVRDVKHSFEFFWNKYRVGRGQGENVKVGSTHGRPIVSVTTLSGEVPAPTETDLHGVTEVMDIDGGPVRAGGKLAPRTARGEPLPVPPINTEVKPHWHKVVLHQGWLLKQGGIGVGAAKSWIKRYFVLYKTSQGHFLTYYSDFTESPLYTSEKNHRNFVDLAKCCFIRPGSNKQDNPDTPAHCFDIVTVEREWTLCAETPENEQTWLKLLTRAVDEDVAILPDEEVVFKVKPKVDPLGVLPSNDYSTSLKVSAFGISVTTPVMGKEGQEVEHYFWVYTDFYKWTLLSQAGKLALLVNVFADATFNRRIEYIFRNKDALRLATAIEFFIEKFMCWMHIRLELMDSSSIAAAVSTGGGGRLHTLNAEEVAQESQAQYAQEINLLDLDMDDFHIDSSAASKPAAFDPFGEAFHAPAAVTPAVVEEEEVAAPAAPAPATFVSSAAHPVEDEDPFAALSAPAVNVPAAPIGEVKVAPPLTAAQHAQHRLWLIGALSANGGPLYDDGTLQVASKIETRGPQCRFTFMHINHSADTITDFHVTVADPAGLMRFELSELPASELEGGARLTQILMLECLLPVAEAPKVTFSYVDATLGKRTATLDLPLVVTTFNEPHALSAEEFAPRWSQLVAPGQEAQEVLKPSYPVVPTQVYGVLTSMLKFARIEGLPDATEFVVYGAATLRTGSLTEEGEKISIGTYVKIEMNVQANAMRVTLRSEQPAAAQAILKTVKNLLL